MKKKYLIVGIIIIVLLLVVIIVYKNKNIKLVDGTKAISNIVFKKSKITIENNDYYFVSTIEAVDKNDKSRVDIIIKSKNGTVLDTLEYKIDKLKPNKKEKIKIKSSKNLKAAYKVNFSVYK